MFYSIRSFSLALIFIFTSLSSFGQNIESHVVASICTCISEKNAISNLDIELGMCMFSATNGNEKAILDQMNIDLTNLDNYEKFGEQIGVQLAVQCPRFLEIVTEMIETEQMRAPESMIEYGIEDSRSEINKEIRGKITSIDHGDFTTFSFLADNGRRMTFYWMGYFEGSESVSSYQDKNIKLSYMDMEVYSAEMENYKTIQVIRKISDF